MNYSDAPSNPHRPTFLVDNQINLHIRLGDQSIVLESALAMELIKFVERTQYVQIANASTKGVPV